MRVFLLALCAFFLPTSALAQSAPPLPTGKLPDTVKPIAYRLDMTILPEQERFSGHTEIDVELKQPAASIFMHGRDLKVAKAVVKIGKRETPVTFTQKTPTSCSPRSLPAALKPSRASCMYSQWKTIVLSSTVGRVERNTARMLKSHVGRNE